MRVDTQFQELIPQLTTEEYTTLEHSLLTDGCRDPLVLWRDTLIDGHNRYAICTKHKLPYKTTSVDLPDKQAAMVWMVRNQFGRRNLTAYQRAELALTLEPLLKQEGKRRMGQGLLNSTTLNTRDELAKQAQVGSDTIRKARYIRDHASEETKQQLRSGDTSIHAEYQRLQKPLVCQNTGCEEWYTPAEYIEAARAVMGSIDLDPASNAIAQKTVKASAYYTAADDGLSKFWTGNVWMNPPYSRGLIDKFVSKLVDHYSSGDISQAVVLTHNCTETRWFQTLAQHAIICFPQTRIKFYSPDNESAAPTQGQAFFYLGDNEGCFAEHFARYGIVCEVRR